MQQTQKGKNKEVSMANSEKLNKHIQNMAREGSKQASHNEKGQVRLGPSPLIGST